jgi:hypothetical protein
MYNVNLNQSTLNSLKPDILRELKVVWKHFKKKKKVCTNILQNDSEEVDNYACRRTEQGD